jgi:hypothetical protein
VPTCIKDALAAGAAILLLTCSTAWGAGLDRNFERGTVLISAESAFAHFGSRLPGGVGQMQDFNLGARVSLLPFDPFRAGQRLPWYLSGARLPSYLAGSLEVGVEPLFQRYNTQHQNFAGAGLALRYHLLGLEFGRFVPWVGASAVPGGTDLSIVGLRGPFMFVIQAGFGLSYFASDRTALYFGYNAQHVSNAWTRGPNHGMNTPYGAVFGVTRLLP